MTSAVPLTVHARTTYNQKSGRVMRLSPHSEKHPYTLQGVGALHLTPYGEHVKPETWKLKPLPWRRGREGFGEGLGMVHKKGMEVAG